MVRGNSSRWAGKSQGGENLAPRQIHERPKQPSIEMRPHSDALVECSHTSLGFEAYRLNSTNGISGANRAVHNWKPESSYCCSNCDRGAVKPVPLRHKPGVFSSRGLCKRVANHCVRGRAWMRYFSSWRSGGQRLAHYAAAITSKSKWKLTHRSAGGVEITEATPARTSPTGPSNRAILRCPVSGGAPPEREAA